MKAVCKANTVQLGHLYGDYYGVSAIVNLMPDQVWRITKTGGYYYAKRGTSKLRLTPRAFNKLFEIVEGEND